MNDQILRQQLVNALEKRQSHQLFETVVKGFPEAHYNTHPANVPYSFWQLLEHMRMTQWDILDYIVNPEYQYRQFPDQYWPQPESEANKAAWNETISKFRKDRSALVDIVTDPSSDLCAQIAHGQPGHNILREILIIATHNSYHIGEFGILRGTLNLW